MTSDRQSTVEKSDSTADLRNMSEKAEPTRNLDRVALLKEQGSAGAKNEVGSGQSSEIGRSQNREPGHLILDNPYAAAGVTGFSRDSRGVGGAAHALESLKSAQSDPQADAYLDKWLKETPRTQPKEEEFKLMDSGKPLDPSKPTVLFLDDFSDRFKVQGDKNGQTVEKLKEVQLNEPTSRSAYDPQLGRTLNIQEQRGLTHGDISATFAEQNGFNVLRADDSHPIRHSDVDGFSKLFNEISDKIESGELKLGKGDVVNLSEGQPEDPTFAEATTRLGLDKNPLTAENYKERKDEILERLKAVSSDPASPHKAWAKDALDTNLAIQRLQAKGVEVVHAAGNEPGKFSIDFMTADHQLSSVDPRTGKPDLYSAVHSNTKAADGVLPIRFDPGPEVGPGKGGRFTIDGTNLTLPGEDFGGLNMKQTITLSHQELGPEQFKKEFERTVGRTAPALNNDKGHLIAVAAGTSFSNVHFLAEQRERLKAKKLGQ